MDARTIASKSVFFILICLFVMAYSLVFGQENSMTSVIVIVLALMMLGKDLSVRPAMNLGGMVLFTLLMGVGAYISVWCGNAFVGAAVNFFVVFTMCFFTTQDLRSPMHFPFLLGYAFLLSVPVSAEDLPVRILALVVGSVLIVTLNVAINRNRHSRTCHTGIASVCDEVAVYCMKALEGSSPSSQNLDSGCFTVRASMYDRFRASFFTTPGDRTVLDIVSSLQMAGRSVCEGRADERTLEGLAAFMETVARHERGSTDIDDVRNEASAFLIRNPDADDCLRASVIAVSESLGELAEGSPQQRTNVHDRIRSLCDGEAFADSSRFTFAVRMSIVFTVWAFAWQYWDLDNAKWLLFTTIALVVPYVDGAWRKSAMRLSGTLMGIAVFAVVLVLVGGDIGLLSVALVVANYVYTVLSPKRYDVMMIFITFSALIAASMSSLADEAVTERILFILLGVVSAVLANYLILPYRIRDENTALGGRYLRLTDRMMEAVRHSVNGTRSSDVVEALATAGVSAKLHMNLEIEQDGRLGAMLSCLDGVASQCTMLNRMSAGLWESGRGCAERILDGSEKHGFEGLTDEDRQFISELSSTMEMRRRSRNLFADMCADTPRP